MPAVSVPRGRHDQLAGIAVRHAVLLAIAREPRSPATHMTRLQAAGRVVDPGMDHLAVARGRHRTDTFGLFQDDHCAAGLGQPPSDREAHHARPDHDALNPVHVQLKPEKLPRRGQYPSSKVFIPLLSIPLPPGPWFISPSRAAKTAALVKH